MSMIQKEVSDFSVQAYQNNAFHMEKQICAAVSQILWN